MSAPATTRLLEGLASLAAPRRCAVCPRPLPPRSGGGWRAALCRGCRARLGWVGGACRGCGRDRGPAAADVRRCRSCRGVPLGGIRSTTALLRYRGVARALLHRVKYGAGRELAHDLGRDLGVRLGRVPWSPAADPGLVVVPIPLHPLRRLRRGFNQADAVAAGLAEALGRPSRGDALRRRRRTRPLYGVPREDRAALVAGAFRARPAAVAGRPVLLVDDIRTSGATLRAAAEAVRRAGANPIDAAVVAR